MKPTLPRGTRDFSPAIMARRTFLLDTIRQVYQQAGFMPLETPAMENLSVLTGKYGEEGEQLLYRILNSGDFLGDVEASDLAGGYKKLSPKLSEKGLRYDLTVPFARYVVMNRNELKFPFKRYQIQPVWRGDSPQKGRYREFYQCDADVVGTSSLFCEAELLAIIEEVFLRLGLKGFVIKLNNRKILAGMAQALGAEGREADLAVAIDKLDKIGMQEVEKELLAKGFSTLQLSALRPMLEIAGDTTQKLSALADLLHTAPLAQEGIAELRSILQYTQALGLDESRIEFDPGLARGLSYYTGAIIEVKAQGVKIGSICGGGRYDNLTGAFGMPGIAGVGISFGIDRIYDVLDELGLFPPSALLALQVMIAHFDEASFHYALPVLQALRRAGLRAEIYPDISKLKKQLDYANARQVRHVLVIGEEEMRSGQLTLKDMQHGTQMQLPIAEIIKQLL